MATKYNSPTKKCDLVMKGGITSGIVYPPAVLKLASTYRFCSIGGTSAGAIAAAVTAAAEYGRELEGFEKLEKVSNELGEGTFLRDLFQPSNKTAPLMNTLFALKERVNGYKGWKAIAPAIFGLSLALLRETTLPFVLGAVGGLGASFFLAWITGGSLSGKGVLLLLFLAWAGGIIGSAVSIGFVVLKHIPENFYGLCTGRKDSSTSEDAAVLTDWLSDSIHRISGKEGNDSPLTFGDLRKKGIQVKMMTSNLSQNLPYELPFKNRFIFKKDEFEKLFPENIINHLVGKSHISKRVTLPDRYYFLPDPDDLPVVVTMRLSLSFPILISAVPLYTICFKAFKEKVKPEIHIKEEDLQRNWFSDGGIASNFPIHFFDAWLPTHPTFGITLVSLPDDAFHDKGGMKQENPKYVSVFPDEISDDSDTKLNEILENSDTKLNDSKLPEEVVLPKANRPLNPDWKPTLGLFQFLWSIFATAQNYRDNTQAGLPSYRERVAQIRLKDNEGGSNLAMSSDTINNVKKKGDRAGEVLLEDFNFDHHQWVRFRVLMGLLESNLKHMEKVLKDKTFPFERLKDLQLELQNETGEAGNKGQKFPYPQKGPWCEEALERIRELEALVERWNKFASFGANPPHPEPVFRVMPEV